MTQIPSATLGGYFSGRHLPSRPTETLIPILRVCGVAEPAISPWIGALSRARRAPGPRPRTAAQPYRGLKHFETEDAEWFFGREQVTQRLLDQIARAAAAPDGPAVVVVTGPSGCGKSSLLRAGVVATTGDDALVLTPGDTPLAELARHLARRCEQGAELVEAALGQPSSTTDWALDAAPALLVIDQFEELFSGQSSPRQREAFIDAVLRLTATARADGMRPVAVLGLRSDFYLPASQQPKLLPALQDNQVLLGPMTETELRSAIVEPAHRSGVSVDDDLVELVVRELAASAGPGRAHDPGTLPLMSHALMETWRHAHRGRLTRADYQSTGGITGAAKQTAEGLFGELSADQQAIARRVFLRLTHVDESQPTTRRRAARSELLDLSADEGQVDYVLNRFVASRLLTFDSAQIEISHESLLVAWPRLAGWIEQDLGSLRRLRQLTAQAQQWDAAGRDDDGLLRGLRLDDLQRWLDSEPRWQSDLNRTELDFIQASVRAEQLRVRSNRRTQRRTRSLLAAVAILALGICMLPGYLLAARARSDQAERDATMQTELSQSRQAAMEATDLESTDPALASQLALAGYRIAPSVEARSALLDSLSVPIGTRLLGQAGPTAIISTADGRQLAMSNAVDGSVQLLRRPPGGGPPSRSGLVPGTGKPNQLFALAFDPKAPILATGGEDSLVRLWNVGDPAHPVQLGQPLTGIRAAVETIAFSPDGDLLAVGGGGPSLWLWDLRDPGRPKLRPSVHGLPGAVQSARFAPDGKTLVIAGEKGLLQRWSVSESKGLARLPGLPNPPSATTIESVAFSPDGTLLAAGSKNGTTEVWAGPSSSHPTQVRTAIPQIGDWVSAVAFAPDGKTLATGNTGNTVTLWSVRAWQLQRTLEHAGQLTALTFLPDGLNLLTASADGNGHIWPLPGNVLTGAQSNVFRVSYSNDGVLAVGTATDSSAAQLWSPGPRSTHFDLRAPTGSSVDGTATISPDGRLAATGTHSGTAILWQLGRSAKPRTLTGPTALVEYQSFSPDSKLLASAGDDNVIHLWDVSDPSRPLSLPTLTGPTNYIFYVAFSQDGRTLAAASVDKTVRLWDISNPRSPRPLASINSFASYAVSVAFAANGRVLVTGGADHLVRLWDISDRAHPVALGPPLTGLANSAFTIAVSPDSNLLAVGSLDRTVRLWAISDPAHPVLLAVLRAAQAQVFTVAFSPDGSTLAASGAGRDVHLWPVSTAAAAKQVCALVGDPITRTEWDTYLLGQRYSPPCLHR
ncbi:MAG: AAA family ATPase [Jatrophihabitantaceae bacterium]